MTVARLVPACVPGEYGKRMLAEYDAVVGGDRRVPFEAKKDLVAVRSQPGAARTLYRPFRERIQRFTKLGGGMKQVLESGRTALGTTSPSMPSASCSIGVTCLFWIKAIESIRPDSSDPPARSAIRKAERSG